jgi:L-alanine-DL-glutamate epimerase-like enolase superfamily enzyme
MMGTAGKTATPVDDVTVHAFDVPADGPDRQEQDGTLTWSSTTIILVEAHGGGETGIGYTYGDVSVATLAESKLAPLVAGADALAPAAAWRQMSVRLSNAGQPGPGQWRARPSTSRCGT